MPTRSNSYLPPPFHKLHGIYQRHEQAIAILFFVGGFIFDMVMLERIDSAMTIGQQGLYLTLIWAGLMQIFLEEARPPMDIASMFVFKRWYYGYRTGFIHFFFGTLLNGYTLFFFKSSSLGVSIAFMIFMALVLVANESHRFKNSGLTVKFALLALCMLCYFSYVTPILVGSIGTMVFLLSVLLGTLPLAFTSWWIQHYRKPLFESAKRQILVPAMAVLLGFSVLYALKWIPPVPLSIPFIGVYHSVEKVRAPEKTGATYRLAFERPWWKIWQNGDQEFHAQRADKIHVFFRIFSPTRFSDKVMMRWFWKDNLAGWVLQDSIPINIVGGRNEGFRGYGVKSNYQPGKWKVEVDTMDDREIGHIKFTLDVVPDSPRNFEYQMM